MTITLLGTGTVRVLLCDADGNLFPSEDPAFAASTEVTHAALAQLGVERRVTAEELRLGTTGKNFRATMADLAAQAGVELGPEDLASWVAREKEAVSAFLARELHQDPAVIEPLRRLGRWLTLAAVSSSALSRLDACFRATGLHELFPVGRRFSAEDSLPRPTSKPDPAVYLFAARTLGIHADEAVAVEDSAPGAQSAVAAGFRTIGNVAFVARDERAQRVRALLEAGVATVVDSWEGVEAALATVVSPRS